MAKTRENKYTPTIAIPPGETIKENLEVLEMSQTELSARIGITTKHLSNIINGLAPITYETALKLEVVIGPSAEFWMNLEINYQLNRARLKELEQISQDIEFLKFIPYNEISKLGWVDVTTDKKERVINSRSYYGVALLGLIKNSYSVSFRQGKTNHEISNYGVLAWLRKAEMKGNDIEVEVFNKIKLKTLIPEFRKLTLEKPEVFYPKMKRLCAECGIALVLVHSLSKTYIQGATIWKNDKAILALTVRGKKADIFWFTFFHELAHLIHHGKKEIHINYENDHDKQEDEADSISRSYLISEKQYSNFIKNYPYTDKYTIVKYAKEIEISPCILIGRLLHDELISYDKWCNDMRPSFKII
ncbi:HigA family addiction module antitoxin [Clostridium sp.]|uniref:HigA family addiction module antitoxin n=1 Tax=Clostridium sp. TaxID=1506 RepID=UPI001A5AB11A|nr:HigA family addiction module antitoxin [Clostridium sp.]MBK5242789.1 HigA family addiction module antidote protein [Clostridium sp.]